MNQAIELTLEQDFNLRSFIDSVQKMSHQQAQKCLIEQHRLMMVQDTVYQDLLKQKWQVDLGFTSI